MAAMLVRPDPSGALAQARIRARAGRVAPVSASVPAHVSDPAVPGQAVHSPVVPCPVAPGPVSIPVPAPSPTFPAPNGPFHLAPKIADKLSKAWSKSAEGKAGLFNNAEPVLMPKLTLHELRAKRLRIAFNFWHLPVHRLPGFMREIVWKRDGGYTSLRRMAYHNMQMRESRPDGFVKENEGGEVETGRGKARAGAPRRTPAKPIPDPRVKTVQAQMVRLYARAMEVEAAMEDQLEVEKNRVIAAEVSLEKVEEAWEETKEELENMEREKVYVAKKLRKTKRALKKTRAEKSAIEEKLALAEKEVAALKEAASSSKEEGAKKSEKAPPAQGTRYSKRKRGEAAEELELPEKKLKR